MTEATREAKLSAPHLLYISARTALEALPETGRVSMSGNISAGMPIFVATGESRREMKSAAPDAENMDTATRSAVSVGKSFTQVESPSRAPERKSSKSAFFENVSSAQTKSITHGMASDEINCILRPLSSEKRNAAPAKRKPKLSYILRS